MSTARQGVRREIAERIAPYGRAKKQRAEPPGPCLGERFWRGFRFPRIEIRHYRQPNRGARLVGQFDTPVSAQADCWSLPSPPRSAELIDFSPVNPHPPRL